MANSQDQPWPGPVDLLPGFGSERAKGVSQQPGWKQVQTVVKEVDRAKRQAQLAGKAEQLLVIAGAVAQQDPDWRTVLAQPAGFPKLDSRSERTSAAAAVTGLAISLASGSSIVPTSFSPRT